MKNNRRLKSLISLVIIMAALIMPLTMTAQNGGTDNFFRGGGNDNYENRGETTGGLALGDADTEDPTAPLGSGLLVLTAFGAGYALLKKKED